jgi:hypothetical protein
MKPEAKLYRDLKKNIPSISWNRLENRSLLGTPDLLACTPGGTFFTVELKVTLGNKIRLSPHQISFHVKHPKIHLSSLLAPWTVGLFACTLA